jgi:hypothetical protein
MQQIYRFITKQMHKTAINVIIVNRFIKIKK